MESGYQVLNMVAQLGFDPNLLEKQKIALAHMDFLWIFIDFYRFSWICSKAGVLTVAG